MKLPPVGWAFFALAILIVAGYVLNRGLYIGSEILPKPLVRNDGEMVFLHAKHCHYLHFAGIRDQSMFGQKSYDEADKILCRMFDD